MDIDWPTEFGRWLEAEARSGDQRARTILTFAARALDQLRNLAEPPTEETETATLQHVRQSRRYQLWRVSHAYHPEVAVPADLLVPAEGRYGGRRVVRR